MKPIFAFSLAGILFFTSICQSRAESHKVPFVPPDGKVLLIVGQDKTSIDNYVHDIGIVPGGTMLYTSVQDAESLEAPADNGGGIHDGRYLLNTYPNSVVQVGLWMVGALDGIVKGQYDQNIDKIGHWIKSAHRPVFLRIGYEFDLPANNYEPHAYQLAFRYIVDRFRKEQVNNVAYVWHSYANLTQHLWKDWYPGDDYVDWYAISVFEKPNIYMTKLAELARKHHKGFMIAESTPQGIGSVHGKASWRLWFDPFFQFIKDEKVQIVCYIDYNWETIPMFKGQGWGDARVQADDIVKSKWMNEIKKDKYLNASPELFRILKYEN